MAANNAELTRMHAAKKWERGSLNYFLIHGLPHSSALITHERVYDFVTVAISVANAIHKVRFLRCSSWSNSRGLIRYVFSDTWLATREIRHSCNQLRSRYGLC